MLHTNQAESIASFHSVVCFLRFFCTAFALCIVLSTFLQTLFYAIVASWCSKQKATVKQQIKHCTYEKEILAVSLLFTIRLCACTEPHWRRERNAAKHTKEIHNWNRHFNRCWKQARRSDIHRAFDLVRCGSLAASSISNNFYSNDAHRSSWNNRKNRKVTRKQIARSETTQIRSEIARKLDIKRVQFKVKIDIPIQNTHAFWNAFSATTIVG